MGRPRARVDRGQLIKLARLGCTTEEIGDFFGVSHDTISRRFAKELALGLAARRISLRRMQWKSARSGSVPMQIHLGKQLLGQTDRADVTTRGGPLPQAVFYIPANDRDEAQGDPPPEGPPGGVP